jgi:hypothetical protein
MSVLINGMEIPAGCFCCPLVGDDYRCRILHSDVFSLNKFHRHNNCPMTEVVTAAWVPIDDSPHEDYECNACGFVASTWTANIAPNEVYAYCPNCGAKMESEDNE